MPEIPDNCTLCDTPFDETKKAKDGKRMIFPYPLNHYLCWGCFTKAMDAGLGRLNKKLAEGNLDLSVEEIADTIKPESIESQQERMRDGASRDNSALGVTEMSPPHEEAPTTKSKEVRTT